MEKFDDDLGNRDERGVADIKEVEKNAFLISNQYCAIFWVDLAQLSQEVYSSSINQSLLLNFQSIVYQTSIPERHSYQK